MTIPSTTRKAGPLLGTGAQTAWPFTFKVFAEADILVTTVDDVGVETQRVLDTDYTVALNANQDTSPGGTVTYPISGTPLAVGSALTITGDIDYDQPLDIPAGGNFSPVALENELDRIVMQVQQLREQLGRALLAPVTSSASGQLPAPESNTLIGWDEVGALQNVPLDTIVTAGTYGTTRNDTFTGDGTATAFLLSTDPAVLSNLLVIVDGLVYTPGVDYSLSSGHVAFTVAPVLGADILVRYGQALVTSGGAALDTSFTPAGSLSSTNVQFAVEELDTDVTALSAATVKLTGDQTVAGVKTFSSSPVLPGNASTSLQAVPKQQLDAAVVPATLAPTLFVKTTPKSLSGLSAVEWTGLPSWANEIVIAINGQSGSSTGQAVLRIGTGGAAETTSYTGTSASVAGSVSIATNSISWRLTDTAAAASVHDHIVAIANVTGNTWVYSSRGAIQGGGAVVLGSGSKTLAGALDMVQLIMNSGTFDAGTATLYYR